MATVAPARIAGQVWNDHNVNGLRDAGDRSWPPNILVRLERLGVDLQTWVGEQYFATQADGLYSFDNLSAGITYRVVVNNPGFVTGPILPGGNQFGPGATINEVVTAPIVLAPGEQRLGVDAGTYNPPVLNGVVWLDANGDGQRQVAEPGQPGVNVNLLDAAGQVADHTFTNEAGAYYFVHAVPGDYRVAVEAPAGTQFSPANQGPDARDSDAVASAGGPNGTLVGQTTLMSLVADQKLGEVDIGLIGTPTALTRIGGRMWNDANGNGLQDPGEYSLGNVQIRLLSTLTQEVLGSIRTDAAGHYSFSALPGEYMLFTFGPSTGAIWQQTKRQQGQDRSLDSDLQPGGLVSPINLVANIHQDHIDMGLVRYISLGDRVWNDLNRNGLQDPGEPGVAGVPVTLYDGQGHRLQGRVTDGQGLYRFNELLPGRYELGFEAPQQFGWTTPGIQGAGGGSLVNASTGRTGVRELLSGADALSADAGLIGLRPQELAHIGDWVFDDRNGNGVQDAGDVGLANADVVLLNPATGGWLASTRTDASGHWSLDVSPGSYQIQIFASGPNFVSYRASPALQGNDTALDSNADSHGLSNVFTVAAGQTDLSLDVGGFLPGRIRGHAWLDANGNGQQDGRETFDYPGVAGVGVSLLNAQGATVARASTDSAGRYDFNGLLAGDYSLRFESPAGRAFTAANAAPDNLDSDANPVTGNTGNYRLLAGAVLNDVDAGLVPSSAGLATVQGRVFHDRNHNGLQDAGDTDLLGALVRLLDVQGKVLESVYSNVQGGYSFKAAAGTYTLQVSGSAGWVATALNAGNDDSLDSDINAAGQVAPFTLVAGQTLGHVDMGAYQNLPPLAALLGNDTALDVLLSPLGLVDSSDAAISVTAGPDMVLALPLGAELGSEHAQASGHAEIMRWLATATGAGIGA